ncbi:hypothetical protein FD755_023107 [Muntiacus reevesi]|uniref:ADP-ribosyl cyclase/cyclic ADP-ribose hydrolase n=1 Tax=Muntiacus reevesi TaxID=9886 RepID=A0A5N3VZ64_MUNRE|nr:hypothetical protein FD755_023107 [Muntiacus reevesi]
MAGPGRARGGRPRPVLLLLLLLHLRWPPVASAASARWSGPGTTPHLQSIFLGRCAEQTVLQNPELRDKNCTAIWEAFKVVLDKDPCSVRPSDYDLFINLSRHSIPRDKSLFWENNHLLVMSYAENGHRVVPLCNVLYGRLGDFLNWCRQTNASGLDYQSCPTSEDCENNPVDSFWRSASIQVILGCAAGETHVLPSGPSPFQYLGICRFNLECSHIWKQSETGVVAWSSCSCLESSMDRAAGQAAVHGITDSVEYRIYHVLVSIEDCQLKKMFSGWTHGLCNEDSLFTEQPVSHLGLRKLAEKAFKIHTFLGNH